MVIDRLPSLWFDTVDGPITSVRGPLVGSDYDVVIVGGGFTGLWCARELVTLQPSLRVALVEAAWCGFGASGRNGGWCSALFPVSESALARSHGAERAAAQMAAMRDAVDWVGATAAAEGIDCHFAKGGTLTLATNPAHVGRIRDSVEEARGERWLDADEARARFDVAGLRGAAHTPHCAAIHPLRLARGLSEVVAARGVDIAEATPVAAIGPGAVHLADGSVVRAPRILRCTEGYTPTLRGMRRAVVPLYSLMIATEPLDDATWARIGLADRATFTDGRFLLIYGQRTADGRFAFGGRGAPYHFGSRIRPPFDLEPAVFAELETVLQALVPQIGGARITHRWGGPLGVPRDWTASVGFDAATGVGAAGGYVGDGVSTAALAGRTLARLALGIDDELTALPWVGHRSPNWEPEPLRWLGINLGRVAAGRADRAEARTGRPARGWQRALGPFLGDH